MGVTAKDQIRENVKALQRISAKTAAKLEPRENGASPSYPHLSKPRHTTSHVLYVSVPEEKAPDISAAIEFLRRPGERANFAVIDAILNHAQSCGWDTAG